MILLNPGPVTLSVRVRNALTREDLCHREEEFAALTRRVIDGLASVYEDSSDVYTAVLIAGSGTAAVEAMLSTFASRERPTLILTNGVYGERMSLMLERQGKPLVVLSTPWGEAIDVTRVEAALAADEHIGAVAVVHHETTTGRLNAIDDLARICREHGVGLLLDAVSSFGGEEIRFEEWSPLAVAGSANKCLHGAPGLSFVLAKPDVLASSAGNATSLYLDLVPYYREQAAGWSPYTLPVHLCYALSEALGELSDEGGWRARHARYDQVSSAVRSCLAGLGIVPLLADGEGTAIMAAFRIPEGDSYERIHDELKVGGFVVYAGQSDLKKTIFRIANMGAIKDEDVSRLTQALTAAFRHSR